MRNYDLRMKMIQKRISQLRMRRAGRQVKELSCCCTVLTATLAVMLHSQMGSAALSVQENCSAILLEGSDGAYFVTAMFAFILGAAIALCGIRFRRKTQFVTVWEEKQND